MKLLSKSETIYLINQGFFLVKFSCVDPYYTLQIDGENIFEVKRNVGMALEKNLWYIGRKKTPAYIEDYFAGKIEY